MLQEWIEHAVKSKTDEIFDDVFLRDQAELYNAFMDRINIGIEYDVELDNIFILWARQALITGYKFGMSDMRNILK